jgi:hypothetical protein
MRTSALLRSCAAFAVLVCVPAVSAQSPAEPAAPDAAKPAKEIKLFDGTSLKNWKILDKIDFDGHGEVAIKDGELVLNMGRPMTGVKWAGRELLRTNYEISFQARRIEGSDFFCGMTFPVEKSHCSLILGGWGGSLTGLSSLDGFDASENETTGSMVFKDGQWYRIRLRVTPKKIEVWVDDDPIVDVEIAGRKVSLRWEMDSMPPLGFATYATTGGLKNIVMKPL